MSKFTKFADKDELILNLRTLKYPNGGKFLKTETKKTINGFSHALKDLQTNTHVRLSSGEIRYFNCEEIDKMIIR